jgi:hypothetical protein
MFIHIVNHKYEYIKWIGDTKKEHVEWIRSQLHSMPVIKEETTTTDDTDSSLEQKVIVEQIVGDSVVSVAYSKSEEPHVVVSGEAVELVPSELLPVVPSELLAVVPLQESFSEVDQSSCPLNSDCCPLIPLVPSVPLPLEPSDPLPLDSSFSPLPSVQTEAESVYVADSNSPVEVPDEKDSLPSSLDAVSPPTFPSSSLSISLSEESLPSGQSVSPDEIKRQMLNKIRENVSGTV